MPEFVIKQRGDTAANWLAANPILAERELGWILDSPYLACKIGDGRAPWNLLPVLSGPPGPPAPAPPLASQTNAGLAPAGGQPGEVLGALPDGSYGFVPRGAAPEEWAEGLNAKLNAADYSGFPSDAYIDVAWPSPGGLVGPFAVDGWLFIRRISGSGPPSYQYVGAAVLHPGTGQPIYEHNQTAPVDGGALSVILPVPGGHKAMVAWNAPTPTWLRFIPARRAPGL